MSLFVQLFDTLNGGPASAYQCWAFVHNECIEPADEIHCGKVTRTKAGMVMHLRRVHGIELQQEMFLCGESEKKIAESDKPTPPSVNAPQPNGKNSQG